MSMDDNKTTASTSTTTARTPPTMEATADEGAITCDLPVEERMKDRQIHKAQVLENVEHLLAETKKTLEETQEDERENFRRYKLLEANALQQKTKIDESVQDYAKSLQALKMLAEQKAKQAKSTEVTYKLDENLYSQAVIEENDRVCIWLGANVMVEYGIEEAQQLLNTHLENIQRSNKETDEELDFLRDQITTTEVNLANLFNYGVQMSRRRPDEQNSVH